MIGEPDVVEVPRRFGRHPHEVPELDDVPGEREPPQQLLDQAFGDFEDLRIVEEEREMREGAAHAGLSAVINLTARKPHYPRAVNRK